MQASTVLLVLTGTFLVACNALPALGDQASPELENIVKSIASSLDTNLLACFTKQARPLENTPASLQLDDILFQMDENTGMLLKNIRLPTLPALTAQSIQTDLEYLNSNLQLEAESAVFEADYEITNNKFVSVLPLTSTGVLTATIKNIQISGVAGLTIADNIFQATNMDVKYTPAHVTIEVSYNEGDEKISKQVPVDSIEQYLLAKIKKEIECRMNDIVRAQLNVLLNQQFLDQLFLGNEQMLAHYKDHAAKFTLSANSIIDQLLSQANTALKDLDFDPIVFPDIYKSFSKSILIARFHGSFTANMGGINGLDSLHRYKDVSLAVDNDVVTIFGDIGFQELSIGYSYYSAEFMGFGPTGKFHMGDQDPSIFLKLSVKPGFLNASVEDFKFEHAGYSQLKVDITGFDTLKWIIEKIHYCAAITFGDRMMSGVESKMKNIINMISKYLDIKPFNDFMDSKLEDKMKGIIKNIANGLDLSSHTGGFKQLWVTVTSA